MGKRLLNKNRRRTKSTDEMWAFLEKSSEEFEKNKIKSDKQFAKLENFVKELGKQIGGVNNSFGRLTEDLMFDSLETLLKDNFGVQIFRTNSEASLNGEHIEVDAYGIINGKVNSIYLTEVKTKFSVEAIEQLKTIISKFDKFYPELSDKKKYGILAVPRLTEKQIQQIMSAGFYPVSLKKDMVVLNSPDNFKPKAY